MIRQNEIYEIIRAYFTLKAQFEQFVEWRVIKQDPDSKNAHETVVDIMNNHKEYATYFLTQEEQMKKNCPRCYGKDPEYVHPDDGDPYSDIYEVCPDCGEEWGEA